MRRLMRLGLVLLSVTLALQAEAQICSKSPADFRVELEAYMADLYNTGDMMTQTKFQVSQEFLAAVDDFNSAVALANDQELEQLCLVFDRSPAFRGLATTMQDALLIRGSGEAMGCLDPSVQIIFKVALIVARAAGVITSGASDVADCVDNDNVDWIGGVCALLAGADWVASALETTADILVSEIDDACLGDHMDLLSQVKVDVDTVGDDVLVIRESVLSNLDLAVSTRATQGSVDTVATIASVVDAKIGNPSTDLAADLRALGDAAEDHAADRREFQDLNLRLSIERLLQPGEIGRIATFQLPRSVGGLLEDVRQVVASTIIRTMDSGQSVGGALGYFDTADNHLNNGRFKEAFGSYRMAYQEAVSPRVVSE